jgi:hypothetical protein
MNMRDYPKELLHETLQLKLLIGELQDVLVVVPRLSQYLIIIRSLS